MPTPSCPPSDTWADPATSGGGYAQAQLTHVLALTLWLTGLRGSAAFALMNRALGARVELHDAIALRFDNGAIGTLGGASSHTGAADNRHGVELRAVGDRGMLRIDLRANVLWRYRGKDDEVNVPLPDDAGVYDCIGPIDAVVDAALGKAPPNNSPAELGARTVESSTPHTVPRRAVHWRPSIMTSDQQDAPDLPVGGLDRPVGGLDRGSLRIERIETVAVRAPLARRFEGSAYSMVNRATIITRLFTADGIVAEVYNGDTDAEQPIILDIIHQELAPRVLGRSATDPEGAWTAMEPSTNDILRDRGLALQAIACVDTAIWDALARALNVPLHRLWGSVTDALPMSVIGGYYHLDAAQTEAVVADYARRFAGMKFKVGGRSPAEDAARVRLAREAAGPDFVIMVDANQGYERAEAVEFGRLVADLDIRWFEEPCRWTNDRRWMRDVRYQTGIPVAAGQSEFTLAACAISSSMAPST